MEQQLHMPGTLPRDQQQQQSPEQLAQPGQSNSATSAGDQGFECDRTIDWSSALVSECVEKDNFYFSVSEVEAEFVRCFSRASAWPFFYLMLILGFVLILVGILYNTTKGAAAMLTDSLSFVGYSFLVVAVLYRVVILRIMKDAKQDLNDIPSAHWLALLHQGFGMLVCLALAIMVVPRVEAAFHACLEDHHVNITRDEWFNSSSNPLRFEIYPSNFEFCTSVTSLDIPGLALIICFFTGLRIIFTIPWCLVLLIVWFVTLITQVGDHIPAHAEFLIFLVHLAIISLIALSGAAWEKASRDGFKAIVRLHVSRNALQAHTATISNILQFTIPEHVLRKLIQDGLDSQANLQSSNALVSIAAVGDFDRWSNGLMPIQVVKVLHQLVSHFDRKALKLRLDKLQMSGDIYIVSSGLLSSQNAPRVKEMLLFSLFQVDPLSTASPSNNNLFINPSAGSPFQHTAATETSGTNFPKIRVCMANGDLNCCLSVVRGGCTRLIIGGESVEKALRWLRSNIAPTITVESKIISQCKEASDFLNLKEGEFPDTHEIGRLGLQMLIQTSAADSPSHSETKSYVGSHQSSHGGHQNDENGGDDDAFNPLTIDDLLRIAGSELPFQVQLSQNKFSLTFDAPDVEELALQEATRDEKGLPGNLVLAGLFIFQLAVLVTVVVESAVSKLTSLGQVLSLVFLALSLCSTGSRLLLRWLDIELEWWQDRTTVVATLLFFNLSVVFMNPGIISNRPSDLHLILCVPYLSHTLHWGFLASTTFVLLFVGVLPIVTTLVRYTELMGAPYLFFVVILVAGYMTQRSRRNRFTIFVHASWYLEASRSRAITVGEVMNNIVPGHVAGFIINCLESCVKDSPPPSKNQNAGSNPLTPAPFSNMPTAQMRKMQQFLFVEGWDELVAVYVEVVTNISHERGSVFAYLSSCLSSFAEDFLVINQFIGDLFLIFGPFKEARKRIGKEAALSKAMEGAVAFARQLITHCPPAHFNVAMALSDAYGAVIGSTLMNYNIFGPVAKTCRALVGAIPTASSSCAVATKTFVSRMALSDPPMINFPETNSTIMSSQFMSRGILPSPRAAASSLTEGVLRPQSPSVLSRRKEESNNDFYPPKKWRIRGAGIVTVCTLRKVPKEDGEQDEENPMRIPSDLC